MSPGISVAGIKLMSSRHKLDRLANRKTKSKENDADTVDRATEEPVRRIRGAQALAEAIRAEAWEEFPMDRHAIYYSFGDMEIDLGEEELVMVRDLTDHLTQDTFANADELLHGLSEALASWKGVHVALYELARPERDVA
jgi:hypothetical protein